MDKDILAQKLAALSADGETFENGLRVVSDASGQDALAAILAEVDMTVLPRKLTFRLNTSELTLVAGGRRLRGLSGASKDIKGVIGVLGKPLSRDEPDVVEGLKNLLLQFTTAPGKITVESGEPEVMGGQTDAGISSHALAEMWDVTLDLVPDAGMHTFIRKCGSLADAWIILANDAETTNGGDGAKLEVLKTALSEQWDTFSESVAQLTGEHGFVCLNNALGDHGSVAIIKDVSEAVLICYEPENMTELHKLWSNA